MTHSPHYFVPSVQSFFLIYLLVVFEFYVDRSHQQRRGVLLVEALLIPIDTIACCVDTSHFFGNNHKESILSKSKSSVTFGRSPGVLFKHWYEQPVVVQFELV
jgi:hypothetical protein